MKEKSCCMQERQAEERRKETTKKKLGGKSDRWLRAVSTASQKILMGKDYPA